MSSMLMVDQITNSAGTGSPTFPNGFSTIYASANNTSAQSFSSGSLAVVTNWTTELDTNSAFSAVSGIYTIPVTGVYVLTSVFTFQAAPVLYGLNAVITLNGSTSLVAPYSAGSSASFPASASAQVLYSLTVGDTITFQCSQTSGSTQTLVALASSNRMSVQRIG